MAEPRSAEYIIARLQAVQNRLAEIHEAIVFCREELDRATAISWQGDPDPAQVAREIYRSNSLFAVARDLDSLLLWLLEFEQRKF